MGGRILLQFLEPILPAKRDRIPVDLLSIGLDAPDQLLLRSHPHVAQDASGHLRKEDLHHIHLGLMREMIVVLSRGISRSSFFLLVDRLSRITSIACSASLLLNDLVHELLEVFPLLGLSRLAPNDAYGDFKG